MGELPALTLSFWPLLFLIASGQGFFFAFLLFTNKNERNSNYFLAAFLFFFSYMLVFNFCYWTNYRYHFPHVYFTNLCLNFLFGPLLLLYLDSLRQRPQLQKWWWIHFLPALVFFAYLSSFFFQSADKKILNILGEVPYPFNQKFKWIGWMASFKVFKWHLLGYFTWKIRLYFKLIHPTETQYFSRETNIIRKNWFKTLLILYAAFLFSYLSYFVIAEKPYFQLIRDYLISAIMTIAIYIIAYMGFKRKHIFSGDLFKKVFLPEKKYASSNLTTKAANSIEKALLHFIEKEKPYLNNELKIKDLAEHLQTSPHQLSQVINEKFGKNFNQFINELRVREAVNLLEHPDHTHTYIIQIAYQVGFNNKTTFNASFKNLVGCSPKQYRDQLRNQGLDKI